LTAEDQGAINQAQDLRRAFDQGFAEPARPFTQGTETLLGFRLGGEAYAVRAREIAGLLADQRIVPLPSPVPELIGIAGLRGEIVPVYDLRALLGYAGDRTAGRWIILAGSGPLVGLAFDQLDGRLSILSCPASRVFPHQARALPAHVRETAAEPDGPRAIIDVAAVLETIERASHRAASHRAASHRTTTAIREK
jgi:chemotaxis signal transduction protein